MANDKPTPATPTVASATPTVAPEVHQWSVKLPGAPEAVVEGANAEEAFENYKTAMGVNYSSAKPKISKMT